MKNGRALRGHRRILVALGDTSAMHRAPTGGWSVGCACGWHGGNWPIRTPAQASYRKHLDEQIDQGLFQCKRCGCEKPGSEMRHDYRYVCRICFSQLGSEWQQAHPIEAARSKRNSHLLKQYGVTLDEIERLFLVQGGVCAICGDVPALPHVDHDHLTGIVRGVLCWGCNVGLGSCKDDPRRLRSAITYLEAQE